MTDNSLYCAGSRKFINLNDRDEMSLLRRMTGALIDAAQGCQETSARPDQAIASSESPRCPCSLLGGIVWA